jgi:hypothetical protein
MRTSIVGTALLCALLSPAANAATSPVHAAGGSNQRASTEGCLGQTLFNGIWRVKVTKSQLTPYSADPDHQYWGITMEVRNGKGKTESLNTLDVPAPQIAFADGGTQGFENSYADDTWLNRFSRDLPPGGVGSGMLLYKLDATSASDVKPPTKLLIEIPAGSTSGGPSFGYTVPNPSMRIRLDCSG